MWLAVGLGNPGAQYAANRHNVGFIFLDILATAYHAGSWKTKFSGQVADVKIGAEKICLLKPQTYMNVSGQSVGETAHFFKVPPEKIIVFHDDLDLGVGRVKVKLGGGNGGHNGLKSIDAHIGSDYVRVRIGIGHPGDRARVTSHVLGNITPEEKDIFFALFQKMTQHFQLLLQDKRALFMNQLAVVSENNTATKNQTKENKENGV